VIALKMKIKKEIMKIKALPDKIFAFYVKDGDDQWLSTYDSLEDAATEAQEKALIGIYTLSETGKFRVNRSVEVVNVKSK
jgi:hypothetical protein